MYEINIFSTERMLQNIFITSSNFEHHVLGISSYQLHLGYETPFKPIVFLEILVASVGVLSVLLSLTFFKDVILQT